MTTELGTAVELLRDAAGFPSGKALADAAGVHPSVINRIVNGESTRLHAATRTAIEQATGVPPGTLTQVADGELTAEQAVALSGGRPLNDSQRRSLEWRVTHLEAAVDRLLDHMGLQDAG